VDKMTLAALEATLRAYLDPVQALEEIPTLRMLATTPEELKNRATRLCPLMTELGISAQVVEDTDQVGGGSVPCQLLPAYAVAVTPSACSVDGLERALRGLDRPIIGRITRDLYLFDVRTLWEEDFLYIAEKTREVAL